MKKVLAVISIAVLFSASIFAATGDKLLVKSCVQIIRPSFEIYGGVSEDDITVQGENTLDPTHVISVSEDISLSDVTIYIKVEQAGQSRYNVPVSLKIGASTMRNTDSSLVGNVESDLPSVNDVKVVENPVGYSVSSMTNSQTAEVTFNVNYQSALVAEGSLIGTLNYKWAHDSDFELGNYVATVTLTFDVV